MGVLLQIKDNVYEQSTSRTTKKIMMADSYFAQPITPPFPQPLAIKSLQQTLNIKDTEGLVQFIIASPKRFNESEKMIMTQLKDIQIALISIMSNHLSVLKRR